MITSFDDLLKISPYSLDKNRKNLILSKRLYDLTRHHLCSCAQYKRMIYSLGKNNEDEDLDITDVPFIPVRMFKERDLVSVPNDDIVKIMTSSGTSGQKVSKIYLDKNTASNQQKALVKIVSEFTGKTRMPMIVIDCPSVIKDRKKFSARGAGILGFSIFSTKKIFALNDDMELDFDGVNEFLNQHNGEQILLFGFTYIIWKHFYRKLKEIKNKTGKSLDIKNGVLIHGGGWKKLQNEAVSRDIFHESLYNICGLSRIHDYYGMAEQTGCIYMECEYGHLHTSIFSDVIVRNPKDFSVCAHGQKGIIQVLSSIAESYPGHSILTEDEGIVLGEDDCPCGRKGKYFKISGRIKNAEIRGCSDTFSLNNTIEDNIEQHFHIKYLVGDENILNGMKKHPVKKAFSDEVIEYLGNVSNRLMKKTDGRVWSDIVTLGFWLRKASLYKLKERFITDENEMKYGRGTIFHIAPSNVAVNFAYTLSAGLLCGNANIVRLPSKDFPQVDIIVNAFREALEENKEIKPYICLIKYERNKELNDRFSKLCDLRVIWGGDSSIDEIRKSLLNPNSIDITFADRYSIAVIDSDYYLEQNEKEKIAKDFYNDTYLSDQNACTSPRIVVWIGNNKEKAKAEFWNNLQKIVDEQYNFQTLMGIDKLMQNCLLVSDEKIKIHSLKKSTEDNSLYIVGVDKVSKELMNYRGNCGYFYEYECENSLELREVCDSAKCQTIGMLGEKKWLEPLLNSGVHGIYRVTDIGHTMDFDLIWDGYNLVSQMTKNMKHFF